MIDFDYSTIENRLCPEAAYRDSLTDEEFWAYVYGMKDIDFNYFDDDEPPEYFLDTCNVCGTTGACGYDVNGEPMIHAKGNQ